MRRFFPSALAVMATLLFGVLFCLGPPEAQALDSGEQLISTTSTAVTAATTTPRSALQPAQWDSNRLLPQQHFERGTHAPNQLLRPTHMVGPPGAHPAWAVTSSSENDVVTRDRAGIADNIGFTLKRRPAATAAVTLSEVGTWKFPNAGTATLYL